MSKIVTTAYGDFEVEVEITGPRHAKLKHKYITLISGTQSRVNKAYDTLSSGRLVNMLRAKGVISE